MRPAASAYLLHAFTPRSACFSLPCSAGMCMPWGYVCGFDRRVKVVQLDSHRDEAVVARITSLLSSGFWISALWVSFPSQLVARW